ncbi:hypothetical protein ASE74_19055 [Pedobacter sp. Leaf216]|uniref:sensor histidine kinase n=1 Tax=Pedobacter sp. Leaf216 TaxID=1735684 RepID=UPI0007013E24|nr:HAMP domain-containing sensor histidine kinase [Pedobacter sp. Leaf216]KQM76565.1 hypothetical protein ASE74_19055 [Pedobacter sp. Leaf216]
MQIKKAEPIKHTDKDMLFAKLASYEILNTPAESAFDRITQLAAQIFDVAHAGIGFMAGEQIFVKSQYGLPANSAFAFYKSSPIVTADGYAIGLIYVASDSAQNADEKQLEMLGTLADMVMEKLESRIAIRKTFRAYDDRLHVLVHDLKNPMTTISLQSELLGRIPGIDERAAVVAGKINMQSKRMIDNLNGILSNARKESHSFKPQKAKVDLKAIIEQAIDDLRLKLNHKNQKVLIGIENSLEVFADADKVKVVFEHIIDNAVKFSPKGTEIVISHQIHENEITVAIKDSGVGLTEEDLDKIFLKFAPLSAKATNNENNYGLGLIAVNAIIDIHKGKLWAESSGKDLGTTFYVTLPIK